MPWRGGVAGGLRLSVNILPMGRARRRLKRGENCFRESMKQGKTGPE